MRSLFGAPWDCCESRRRQSAPSFLIRLHPGSSVAMMPLRRVDCTVAPPRRLQHPGKGGYSMSPAPFRSLISLASALVCALTAAAAQAQAPAAPAAPPSWQQGRNAEQEKSSLHPFAIEVTGRSAQQLPVDKLRVPDGFKVEVWAEGLPGARSMALGSKGTVFVGTRQLKDVYAVVDRGGKREAKTLLKGLDSPNGIAFSRGTLYVAERHRITRYDGIESRLDNPPEAKVVVDGLDPQNQPGHFWKFLALGPDGKLYYNVGAPGNIVMPAYFQAAISRVDPKTGIIENYAQGVRNSVGFDWHPQTRQLWFINHGRDWLGDESPNDTLHVATRKGQHFGYPYCHQGDTLDPEFGKNRSCSEFTRPASRRWSRSSRASCRTRRPIRRCGAVPTT